MYFARSQEPNFHPEFGLVCPSSTFRRVVRVALVSIAFGAVAGAIGVFALAPRSEAAREKALNIIFADRAAAANAVSAATIGKGPPPSAALPGPTQAALHQPAQPAQASRATEPEDAASAASEEPKLSRKKKKKRAAAQSRPRKRDRDVAEVADPGAYASSNTSRFGQPRRDDNRNW